MIATTPTYCPHCGYDNWSNIQLCERCGKEMIRWGCYHYGPAIPDPPATPKTFVHPPMLPKGKQQWKREDRFSLPTWLRK